MRKVILNLAVSLDGFIEGSNKEIDWCIMDEEMNFDAFIASIDTVFYGRISYEAWGNYIPEEISSEAEKMLMQEIHSKNKFVFSTQPQNLSSTGTNKVTYIGTDIAEKVNELKNQEGKDIWLYGGASLIKSFIDLDLIDVYKISVHPTVLGSGKPLFEDLKKRVELKLLDTRVFKCGVVELTYEPIRKTAADESI